MKTIADNLTPEQAWRILASISHLKPVTKPLVDTLDHCLAESFAADGDIPASPRSFMDGFAVRASDVVRVPVRLRLGKEILMGEGQTGTLRKGEAIPIPTGGFLPAEADAVVMQEDTEIDGDFVIIRRSVQKDENVQQRGEDFLSGQLLFSKSHRLRAQDLSTIATFGVTTLLVVPKPSVAIISTGNELVPYTAHAQPGQIRETNAMALAGALQKFGFHSESLGIVRDDFDQQKTAMQSALEKADVILVSGGSSVGARDYTMEVIRSFPEHTIHFHGLAIRPGNPTIFATIGSHTVFGLPGQPVSSLIVFYLFVLPFLNHIAGFPVEYSSFPDRTFAVQSAKLTTEIKPLKIKTDYVRLKLERSGNEWLATPVLGKSASLSTLTLAHGFTIITPGNQSVTAGTQIKVFLFP